MIVEDDEALAALLDRILKKHGFTQTLRISDPRRALLDFREWKPDLVIMDVQMPHLDGITVMQQIRSRMDSDAFLPFLLITGDAASETRQRALEAGASDFLTKPFDPAEVTLRARNLIDLRNAQLELARSLGRSEAQRRQLELDLVARLTLAVKLATSDTASDPEQVGELSANIARALALPDEQVEQIRLAAPLCDIGMMGVSDRILSRDESLSLEELDQIRSHTARGAQILANSDLPLLQLAEEIALYHHEAWDGSGYIPGVARHTVPLAARIVAVADTYCAMTGRRAYQSTHSPESAVAWIESQSGSRFDPAVVSAFMRVCAMHELPMLNPDRATQA
jgi:putative two-component system response regulator